MYRVYVDGEEIDFRYSLTSAKELADKEMEICGTFTEIYKGNKLQASRHQEKEWINFR